MGKDFRTSKITVSGNCIDYTLDRDWVHLNELASIRWEYLDEFIEELRDLKEVRKSMGLGGE